MPTGHAKATVDGNDNNNAVVIAETDSWEEVEGNVYFPPSSIKKEYFVKTNHSTHCPWKGDASYYTIKVDDQELENAAWYYPETKEKAENIRNHVAFYKTKVNVTKT